MKPELSEMHLMNNMFTKIIHNSKLIRLEITLLSYYVSVMNLISYNCNKLLFKEISPQSINLSSKLLLISNNFYTNFLSNYE